MFNFDVEFEKKHKEDWTSIIKSFERKIESMEDEFDSELNSLIYHSKSGGTIIEPLLKMIIKTFLDSYFLENYNKVQNELNESLARIAIGKTNEQKEYYQNLELELNHEKN